MIIQGVSRSNAVQGFWYLLDKKRPDNEKVKFLGFANTDGHYKDIAQEWEAIALGTHAEKPFYHASINLRDDEKLTPEQWERAIQHTAERLGLSQNEYLAVMHEKEGRGEHVHLFFNRISLETGHAINMGWDYMKRERAARELEKEFGLERVKGGLYLEKGEKRPERGPIDREVDEANRKGVNLYKWRQEIRAIVATEIEKNENVRGWEIIEALEAKGHIVAVGRKDNLMIIAPDGAPKRMPQNLGITKKSGEWERLFGEIDPRALPNVEQAQEIQKKRAQEIEQEKEKKAQRREARLYERPDMVSQQRDAMKDLKDKKKDNSLRPERPDPARQQERDSAKCAAHQAQNERPVSVGYSQRLSNAHPVTQAEVRKEETKARTEQTESKQRRASRAAMQEVFDQIREERAQERENAPNRERGGGRERER